MAHFFFSALSCGRRQDHRAVFVRRKTRLGLYLCQRGAGAERDTSSLGGKSQHGGCEEKSEWAYGGSLDSIFESGVSSTSWAISERVSRMRKP